MLKISQRPLNAQEKKAIKSQHFSDLVGKIELIIGSMMVCILIFLLPFLTFDKYYPVSSKIESIVLIFILVIAAIITGIIYWKFQKVHNFHLQKKLKEIQAEIWHIKTSRAIKREDPEDLGVGFYIDIINGNKRKSSLFLWGQYMDMLEYDKKFPNTEFKIIRRSDTQQILDIEVFGQYFKPERTIPFFSDEDWRNGNNHEDGEILEMSIEQIN